MKLEKIFLCIAVGFIAVSFNGCNLDDANYSKDNHLKTNKIKDSLYNEIYLIRSLSTGEERYSEYLTDSVSFRKYVCTHDFGQWLYGVIGENDALTVYQITGNLLNDKQVVYDTVFLSTYNIKELKQEGKFE